MNKGITMTPTPLLVEFDYPDHGHFSEIVKVTETQAAALREILERAEAVEAIRPDWYVGEPPQEPMPFDEFMEQLRWAVGPGVVDPDTTGEAP